MTASALGQEWPASLPCAVQMVRVAGRVHLSVTVDEAALPGIEVR